MPRIYLSRHPDQLDLPRDGRTLWLYHQRAKAPAAPRRMTLAAFMNNPWQAVDDVDLLVVVGLVSAMVRPGNRVELGQFLTEPWPGPPRVSVDDKLFLRDPWRLWWHFGCVGIEYGGYNVSYTLEGHWNQFVIGKKDNPCSPTELDRYGAGVIAAQDPFRFDPVDIHVEMLPQRVHERYAKEKEAAFDEERTPLRIIKRLAAFADRAYPFRQVPSYSELFRQPEVLIRATDLGVDRFLVGQLRHRIEIINYAARRFSM